MTSENTNDTPTTTGQRVRQRLMRTVDALRARPIPCACSAPGGHSDACVDFELEREYEKFFQAVEASPSSVIITNRDGVIEYVNERFIASTAYTREQAVGRKPSLLKSGRTAPEVYDELWDTISSGKIWRGEMCNRKRTGEHYWEATAIAPILGTDGEISHFVAVKEDITERRRAESELQRRQVRDAILADVTRVLLAEASADGMEEALNIMCKGLNAERGFLFRISNDDKTISNTYEWPSGGASSRAETFVGLACERFEWSLKQYHAGKSIAVDSVTDLPSEAEPLKSLLQGSGVQASLTAPIEMGDRFIGFVGVDVKDGPRVWSLDDIRHLERVAEIVGLALLRMDAEEELRQTRDRAYRAEQNLTDAIESMPAGFVLYDQDGSLVICNSRFRNDYGYSEAQTAPGVHFTDLGRIDVQSGRVVVPDGYKDADTYLQTKLKYRLKLEGTFPVVLKDGRHLMTRDRRTSSGGLVSVQTDITQIKQTEEALRTSERKFWSVFHASPSLMTISVLQDGRFIDVNAKWVEVMGYDYSEAVGKTAEELGVWPTILTRGRMLEMFDVNGVLSNFETRLKTRSGKMRDLLISGVRMHIDDEEALLLVHHDITERKIMERALKHSEQEVRTILDNIVEAFYRTDSEGNITMCSAAVENLLGYRPGELIGTPARNVYVDPDARDGFVQALKQNGGRLRDYEVRLKRKDGMEIWAASSAHYIYDRDDNVVGLEGTTRDITRRKKAEHALLLAKEQAEQASAAKTDFLSGMSHELRTPLNAIIGFSQMMELQIEQPLTDKQTEYLDIIRTSGEHLLTLINEILDLAQVEAGRMQVRLGPVSAHDVIEECVTLVRPVALKRSVRFTVDKGDDADLLIQVDRMKFKQTLLNLMSNAVKYNVEGGRVSIAVRTDDKANLRIDITDSGHGLSADECSQLFEPFQRLGAERSDVEGTGLGLVLAKRMIDAMGGDIRVTSAPGLGSTFTLIVPLVRT